MVQPWKPITNLCDLRHLGKLSEELGEASAVTSRCIIQGVDSLHPETGKPNRRWLEEEIADVLACLDRVVERFNLDKEFIMQREAKKITLLREWHGMLEG